jgi:hypothetical protein
VCLSGLGVVHMLMCDWWLGMFSGLLGNEQYGSTKWTIIGVLPLAREEIYSLSSSMKNIIMKPKMTKTRKNSKNKNRLIQTRLTISPQLQERIPIQPYMRKKLNRNNPNNWKH